MKSPAFQWYAADYLADERVILMSLEAEGVYTRLLSYCWREGSIPADAKLLSRMCKGASLDVIEEVLPCFMEAEQPGRLVHKRLEEERAKQEAYRVKQAEKGKLGGRPPKAGVKPEESHGFSEQKPEESHGEAGVKPEESHGFSEQKPEESHGEAGVKPARLRSSTSSSISSSKEERMEDAHEGQPASQPLSASPSESKPKAASTKGGRGGLVWPAGAEVFKQARFIAYTAGIGYGNINTALYLPQILNRAEEINQQRDESGWELFIRDYLNLDNKHNRLMINDPPGGYTAPAGGYKNPNGPAPTPKTTGDNYAERIRAQKTANYL